MTNRKIDARGFTLMELLIVLLIIGVLSTIALRTIDATRDRSLFDQTAREMRELVQGITGNPDLIYDGRRTDFGFYGDMGRLPFELRELVTNVSNSTMWRGPYVRRDFVGDTANYLLDAWGNFYSWDDVTGTLSSLGNGRYPLTMRVVDSLPQLVENVISGNITDVDNNPPGEIAEDITIELYTNVRQLPFINHPDAGGYYEYSVRTLQPVPMGTHRLVVKMPPPTVDSLSRWVTVTPRSRTVVDLRFNRSFRNKLKMVGSPIPQVPETTGFSINVVNIGTTDDTITSLTFSSIEPPDSAYMTVLSVDDLPRWIAVTQAIGSGGTVPLSPPAVVPGNLRQEVRFQFFNFVQDSLIDSLSVPASVGGRQFNLRFSDGSEITVTP